MGGTREERERLAESRPRVPVLIWGTAVTQDVRPHKLQATVFSAHSEFLEVIFLKISLNVHPFPRRKLSPLPGPSLGQARETSLRRRPPGSRRRAVMQSSLDAAPARPRHAHAIRPRPTVCRPRPLGRPRVPQGSSPVSPVSSSARVVVFATFLGSLPVPSLEGAKLAFVRRVVTPDLQDPVPGSARVCVAACRCWAREP